MTRHRVCAVDDLTDGEMRPFRVGAATVALARNREVFYAFRDVCPHQGAPMSQGRLEGTVVADAVGQFSYVRHGEIVRCPWHGWEFDARSGASMHDPGGCRIAAYRTTVEDGNVFVVLGNEKPEDR